MIAPLFSTSVTFYDIFAQACVEIKILRQENKVTYVFPGSAFAFFNFFRFSFLPFLFFAAVMGLLMGLLAA